MPSRDRTLSLGLFAVYLLLYGGFVFLNAFAPETMEATPIAGVSLAILYGFGLIIAAFVLAMVYGILGSDGSEGGNGANGSTDAKTEGEA